MLETPVCSVVFTSPDLGLHKIDLNIYQLVHAPSIPSYLLLQFSRKSSGRNERKNACTHARTHACSLARTKMHTHMYASEAMPVYEPF